MEVYYLFLLFFFGLAISWLGIPAVVKVVMRYKIYQKPKARDLHQRRIPKLTGIVFYFALLFISLAFLPYTEPKRLFLMLCSTSLIVFLGIRDDVFEMGPYFKLFVQMLAISFLIFGDQLVIYQFHGFLGLNSLPLYLAYPLTYFVGIFMINAFNLCDGIDGLAGLLGIVMLSCYGLIFYLFGDVLFFSYALTLIGCLIAFLRFNLSEDKKVFMGDTGSLFLGFIFFVFTLQIITNDITPVETFFLSKELLFVSTLCIFIVPILDTGSIFFYRILNGVSPFKADNNHLHHLVLKETKSHAFSSIIISVFLLSTIGLFVGFSFIFSPEQIVILYFGLLVFLYVLLYILRTKNKKQS